jgi:hypothetical protein
MQLTVLSPTDKLPEVKFNYEELKTGLTESLKKYQGLVYTDDTIKDAKTDRATLNKLKTALAAKRIELKKMYLEPYAKAENQIKELEAMIDEPTQAIDKQVKAYEELLKEEKRAEIEKLYEKVISSDNKPLLTLDKIFDQKWLNKSTSMTQIEQAMEKQDKKVTSDLNAIHDMNTPHVNEMVAVYMDTLNISDVLRKKTELEKIQEQREEAERKRKEREEQARIEKERLAKEAETKPMYASESEDVIEEPEPVKEEPKAEQPQEEKQEEITVEIKFCVWVTEEQKILLRDFLKNNNIKYGAVK